MKQYFKYRSGFVNIDDENLFLTNSGNWQETWDLGEKSAASRQQNTIRVTRMKVFVYSAFGMIASAIVAMLDNIKVSISLVVGLGLLAYYLFQYFKSDFGNRYKIPLAKIDKIEKYDKGLKIHFRNEASKPDFEIIDDVDAKGFTILENLNLLPGKAVNSITIEKS